MPYIEYTGRRNRQCVFVDSEKREGGSTAIVRIAHISDTHLGYTRYAKLCPETNRNQREVDVQEAYGRAVDEILDRDVDLVIHSGDVFDSVRPATHVIIGFL